ncbi:hypothetical protein LZF96_23605 [Streptomyces sp. ST2-7A]|nr:hypothetical protein [Streptomyces sp. ST2-7A]MCE7083047.1 hypothetical protein [Streptomyces sp. ST2-7A]
MQREEDRTRQRLDIPVPPKYKSSDFLKPSYRSHRGKPDVPKERFISYPEASPENVPSLLLGWAGWDHSEQALALIGLIDHREQQEAWDTKSSTAPAGRVARTDAVGVAVAPHVRPGVGERSGRRLRCLPEPAAVPAQAHR